MEADEFSDKLAEFIQGEHYLIKDRFITLQRFDYINGCWDDSAEIAGESTPNAMVRDFCQEMS